MRDRVTGRKVDVNIYGVDCQAFVPEALPPEPPLQIDQNLRETMDQALLSLGRLDSLTTLLPDTSLFLYMYVRKEAVLSSQIEGTQSSLSDLLLFESESAPGVPLDDVQEVSSYVVALDHGLERLKRGSRITGKLLREMHAVLLRKGRGSAKHPGRFRSEPNWIGGSHPRSAIFVPPPKSDVLQCIKDLERFLHDDPERTSALVKAALAHVQFETIHPFLDGNGRLGRLLITLVLCEEGILKKPMLYLSLYFKRRRDTYYDLLQRVRFEGEWEEWLRFFVEGVMETADSAVETAQRLMTLFECDRARIQDIAGRKASSVLRVHQALQAKPILTVLEGAERTGLTVPTVASALRFLVSSGLVTELTGKKRKQAFGYSGYIRVLNEGTELAQE